MLACLFVYSDSDGPTTREIPSPNSSCGATGRTGADSTTGDVLAGATDACTAAGARFETVFVGFPEQPRIVTRMPADSNKKTFFMLVSSQGVRRGSYAQCS